ncbi:MAG: quinol dehydrogenase ferredoxin subunit NapH [Campylobacteraceae bacterium]|jgi:ferredoxin-type protein NapH|nr:quinol dehydrogenase ferredoxin subunit NapH [Campylobacteraceae bacterium]
MRVNILRRVTQILILVLFILGNLKLSGILVGNLSSSRVFGTIPLSDPFAVLQIYLANLSIGTTAILGATIVLVFYSLIAPRAFCGFVCPVNLVTDFAYFIRQKFGFSKDRKVLTLPKNFRYYFLALSLILSFIIGVPAFENISHVGVVQRGIIFLNSSVLGVIFAIFVFDLFIMERGVCSHICPLGAFYALTSKYSFIRIKHDASKCNKCMDCKTICPEKQVLNLVGKTSGYINSECISCGRCVDVCHNKAFSFEIRKGKL